MTTPEEPPPGAIEAMLFEGDKPPLLLRKGVITGLVVVFVLFVVA